jgi:Transcriptional regulatory protein, C terminal
MRVNSALKSFSSNPLIAGSGMVILIAIFFVTSSFTKNSDRHLRAKQANVLIRQIGHRLLLQAGDFTSRVLPVTEIKEGTFVLKFQNEFVFNHDSLMMLTQSLFPPTQFPSGYTVTVHECLSASIVFGFQVTNTLPGILACKGRSSPHGCYTIEIAFPDLYTDVEQQKADIHQPSKELKLASAVSQEANPTHEEFKTTLFGNPLTNLLYSGMLVLLGVGVTLLIGRFGKILTPVPVPNQGHSIIKEFAPQLPALGKFLFDATDQRLLVGSEVISLTDKECKILELLNKDFGELIPRETLMQKIWIDEGVITSRSLDMFVSKLRKKLSSDPELKITNVHGKGYKLEILGI